MNKQTILGIFDDDIKVEQVEEETFELNLTAKELEIDDEPLNINSQTTANLEEVNIDEQFDTLNISPSETEIIEKDVQIDQTSFSDVLSETLNAISELEEQEEIEEGMTITVENDNEMSVNEEELISNTISTGDLNRMAQTGDFSEGDFKTLDTTRFTQEVGEMESIVDQEETYELEIKSDIDDSEIEVNDFGRLRVGVIGVGGCGCNAIHRMYSDVSEEIDLIAIDTDEGRLNNVDANSKILIGQKLLSGNGSGNDSDKVRESFQESYQQIEKFIKEKDMVFVVGSLVGGTGKVGMIEIGKMARDLGILSLAFAISPIRYEADLESINKHYNIISQVYDSTVLIDSDKVLEGEGDLTIEQAQEEADRIVTNGIRGIFEVATKPGKLNLDFADIKTAFKNSSTALLSLGYGQGNDSLMEALDDAMNSKFIDIKRMANAKSVIFSITLSPETVTIAQMEEAVKKIYSFVPSTVNQFFFGISYDETYGSKIKATLVATGLDFQELKYEELKIDDNLLSLLDEIQPLSGNEKVVKQENTSNSSDRDFLDVDFTGESKPVEETQSFVEEDSMDIFL